MNQEEIEIANKTSRNTPAIGAKALTPQFVRAYIDKHDNAKCKFRILDFGAGKTAAHTLALINDGYYCTAHEFGDNADIHYHNTSALARFYDVVFASNVLNTQSSEEMLRETLGQIVGTVKKGGVFFANYPLSPRKCTLLAGEVEDILNQYFTTVYFEGGNIKAPVWKCIK